MLQSYIAMRKLINEAVDIVKKKYPFIEVDEEIEDEDASKE